MNGSTMRFAIQWADGCAVTDGLCECDYAIFITWIWQFGEFDSSRIAPFDEANAILPESVFDFRKGRSATRIEIIDRILMVCWLIDWFFFNFNTDSRQKLSEKLGLKSIGARGHSEFIDFEQFIFQNSRLNWQKWINTKRFIDRFGWSDALWAQWKLVSLRRRITILYFFIFEKVVS